MKRVDPSVYTKKYYLTDCSGYGEFKKSGGKILEPRFKEVVKYLKIKKGMKVLDIGCGRGELVFWAAEHGADAYGIDYSKDAIDLAKKALPKRKKGLSGKVYFEVSDGKKMKFRKNFFDLIILTEVLEHLYKEEQVMMFKNIHKILKKGGVVFIHTAPSKWFNEYIYRYWCYPISTLLVSISNKIMGHDYGNLPKLEKIRTESHKVMHVNEPDYFSLKNLFYNTGFRGEIISTNITVLKPIFSWKDNLYNFLVYLYPLSKYSPFNILWGNDFMATLRKK